MRLILLASFLFSMINMSSLAETKDLLKKKLLLNDAKFFNQLADVKSAKVVSISSGKAISFYVKVDEKIEDIRVLNGKIGISKDIGHLYVLLDFKNIPHSSRSSIGKEVYLTNSKELNNLFNKIFSISSQNDIIYIDFKKIAS